MPFQRLEPAYPDSVSSLLAPADTAFEGADSDYGPLKEVLVASPQHLSIVPCNRVSEESLRNGQSACTIQASAQHRALVDALAEAGVRVRTVKPVPGLPDLAFARDSSLMTPWGLIGLKPGARHRQGEVDVILEVARSTDTPVLGRIEVGRVEGGDVCLLRPGHVVIGISEHRTNLAGAQALGGLFEARGWRVTCTPVEPDLLHLDTHFCMLDRNLALGCLEKLDPSFLEELAGLGIDIVPVSGDEVSTLGCNVLALGRKRIISTGSAPRVDQAVRKLGFEVTVVALDEFTQCGGGVHCLTMPLRRSSP